MMVVSDQKLMVVERMTEVVPEPINLVIDDVLFNQLATVEALYSGHLEIQIVPGTGWVAGKTSYGYTVPYNMHSATARPKLDCWHEVLMQCADPAPASNGAMVWNTSDVQRLGQASPSGKVLFETNIACNDRPVLIRDVETADWVGCFQPRFNDGIWRGQAEMPEWCK